MLMSNHDAVGQELKFNAMISNGGAGESEKMVTECSKYVGVVVENKETKRVVYKTPVEQYELISYNGTKNIEISAGTIQKDWLAGVYGVTWSGVDSTGLVKEAPYAQTTGNFKLVKQGGGWRCEKYSDTQCSGDKIGDERATGTTLTLECFNNNFVLAEGSDKVESGCLVFSQQTDRSDRSCANDKPFDEFRATFTMYDTEDYYGMWRVNPNSITTYDGAKQEITIDFSLRCGPGEGEPEPKDDESIVPTKIPELSTSQHEIALLIIKAAKEYGIDVKLALALAWQESGFDNTEISKKMLEGLCKSWQIRKRSGNRIFLRGKNRGMMVSKKPTGGDHQ